ncbi:MAG: hypothetical protein R3F21_17735 [Myxococcota bacterium]
MSKRGRIESDETGAVGVVWAPGPSESASAIEHQAALDATLFRTEARARELILELDSGELRLRRPNG